MLGRQGSSHCSDGSPEGPHCQSSNPDHRPTTSLYGGENQGPETHRGGKALAWKSEEWGSNLSPASSWLCDLGQVTFPLCIAVSSPLKEGIRIVPAAQGYCRNYKLDTLAAFNTAFLPSHADENLPKVTCRKWQQPSSKPILLGLIPGQGLRGCIL